MSGCKCEKCENDATLVMRTLHAVGKEYRDHSVCGQHAIELVGLGYRIVGSYLIKREYKTFTTTGVIYH